MSQWFKLEFSSSPTIFLWKLHQLFHFCICLLSVWGFFFSWTTCWKIFRFLLRPFFFWNVAVSIAATDWFNSDPWRRRADERLMEELHRKQGHSLSRTKTWRWWKCFCCRLSRVFFFLLNNRGDEPNFVEKAAFSNCWKLLREKTWLKCCCQWT